MLVTSCPQVPCQRLDDPLFLWGSPGCLMGVSIAAFAQPPEPFMDDDAQQLQPCTVPYALKSLRTFSGLGFFPGANSCTDSGTGAPVGILSILAPNTGLTLAKTSETRLWRTDCILSVLIGRKSE